ncbi:MAG: response regulator [Thermodesulfobacteriota bacterium]
MMFPNTKVLLAENPDSGDASLKGLLELHEMTVIQCSDSIEAVRKSFRESPDLIILEYSLPLMDAFHAARILKNDPFMLRTPIIVIGSPTQQIDKYWADSSGADFYIEKPVDAEVVLETFKKILPKRTLKGDRLKAPSIMPVLSDTDILSLANSILDKTLFKSSIISELNSIDTQALSLKDTVKAVMEILSSLYEFSSSMVLFNNHEDAQLITYKNLSLNASRIAEIKENLLNLVSDKYSLFIEPTRIVQTDLQSDEMRTGKADPLDLYLHGPVADKRAAFIAIDGISYERLLSGEQVVLKTFLDAASRVLENKFVFDIAQKFSIIDTVAQKDQSSLLQDVIANEMSRARTQMSPLTLLTLDIAEIDTITEGLRDDKSRALFRLIFRTILSSISKNNIVTRLNNTSFAFLMIGSGEEKSGIFLKGLKNILASSMMGYLPRGSKEPVFKLGMAEFEPSKDLTSAGFLSRAMSSECFEEITKEPLEVVEVEPVNELEELEEIETIIDLEDVVYDDAAEKT